jgi:hypothetical protein
MCNSNDFVKQEGLFVCQACGVKYSVEEAKKMMIEGAVEVTGTVNIANPIKIENTEFLSKLAIADNWATNFFDKWSRKKGGALVTYTDPFSKDYNEVVACYNSAGVLQANEPEAYLRLARFTANAMILATKNKLMYFYVSQINSAKVIAEYNSYIDMAIRYANDSQKTIIEKEREKTVNRLKLELK